MRHDCIGGRSSSGVRVGVRRGGGGGEREGRHGRRRRGWVHAGLRRGGRRPAASGGSWKGGRCSVNAVQRRGEQRGAGQQQQARHDRAETASERGERRRTTSRSSGRETRSSTTSRSRAVRGDAQSHQPSKPTEVGGGGATHLKRAESERVAAPLLLRLVVRV